MTNAKLGAMPLETYLDQLASAAPAPGGGAAVALTGAQAAALLSMCLNVTGEKAGELTPEGRARLLRQLDDLRARFLVLADADAAAFGAVMAAYKLPQKTDEEKAARKDRIQDALKGATDVPLEVMERLTELFPVASDVIQVAKASVVSDAAIAVHLMAAALKAARYNVDINLKYLKDEPFKARTELTVKSLLAGRKNQRKCLLKTIKTVL